MLADKLFVIMAMLFGMAIAAIVLTSSSSRGELKLRVLLVEQAILQFRLKYQRHPRQVDELKEFLQSSYWPFPLDARQSRSLTDDDRGGKVAISFGDNDSQPCRVFAYDRWGVAIHDR